MECFNLNKRIPRISYAQAIEILKKRGHSNIKKLNKQNELELIEEIKGPFFILNFPVEINPPFYMKRNKNGNLVIFKALEFLK